MPTRLRFAVLATLLATMPTIATTQANPPAQPPISLLISTQKQSVRGGSPIAVDLAMTNVSNQTISVSWRHAPVHFEIRDSEGKPVPAIERTEKQPPARPGEVRAEGGSYQGVLLEAGKSSHEEHLLNSEFDLSKPGTYSVQAIEGFGNTATKSNVLTIIIVP